MAAGILGCGPVILGASDECAKVLEQARSRVEAGQEPAEATVVIVQEIRSAGGRVPGFGHPVHRPVDPRAEAVLELADERGVSGHHVVLAQEFREAVAAVCGKPLPMNVAMPIAAVMLDLGFSPNVVKAVPILARTAGLLGHLAEERRAPVGFFMAGKADAAVEYLVPA